LALGEVKVNKLKANKQREEGQGNEDSEGSNGPEEKCKGLVGCFWHLAALNCG